MRRNVAWQGEFEFLGAAWNDRDGRTALFRVVEDARDRSHEHPFKHFTRKRGGRVGTRFHLSYARPGEEEAHECEVMLLDWTENAGGRSVKFWVDYECERHPFEGMRRPNGGDVGDTLMVAMVEVGDDDQPVAQVEADEHGRPRQRLSNVAALMCKEQSFWAWLTANVKGKSGKALRWNEELAARWIRHICEIESRSQLDADPVAANRFHEHVRKPYRAYQELANDQRMRA